jgi:hypothetical protein
MNFIKDPERILSSFNLLNLILAGITCTCILTLSIPELTANPDIQLPKPKPERSRPVAEQTPDSDPSLEDAILIADQNPFHSTRRIIFKKDEKIEARPDIVLYGTMITKNGSFIYMEDKNSPLASPGRGKRQRVMKKGEVIGGYVLSEILSDRIILTKGEDRITVHLTGHKDR